MLPSLRRPVRWVARMFCPKTSTTARTTAVSASPIRSAESRRSVEPVVEVHLGVLAEVGAESAFAAQAGQLAGARSGHYEPVARHHVPGHGARVLQQEASVAARYGTRDPLDSDEARRTVGPCRLQELDHAGAFDVPAERFLHVDANEGRPVGRCFVGGGLVRMDRDDGFRPRLAGIRNAHVFPWMSPDRARGLAWPRAPVTAKTTFGE